MTGLAQVAIDGGSNDYPVLSGTVGPEVIDIRKLYGNTGRFTFETRTLRVGLLKPNTPLLPSGLLGPVTLHADHGAGEE